MAQNKRNETQVNVNGKSVPADSFSQEQLDNLLRQINQSISSISTSLNPLQGSIPEVKTSSTNGRIHVQLNGETLLDLDLSDLIGK